MSLWKNRPRCSQIHFCWKVIFILLCPKFLGYFCNFRKTVRS
jgi:hypothetical protein